MQLQDFRLLGGFWRLSHAALRELHGPRSLRLETDTQLSLFRSFGSSDADLMSNLVSVDVQNPAGGAPNFNALYLYNCSQLAGMKGPGLSASMREVLDEFSKEASGNGRGL